MFKSRNHNRTRKLILLLVIALCVSFSIVYVFLVGGGCRSEPLVQGNEALNTAVSHFYTKAVSDDEIAQEIESVLANYSEYGEASGIATDSLESLNRYLGHLSFRSGDWAEAIQWYRQAMLLNEESSKKNQTKRLKRVDYQCYIGNTHLKNNDFEKAKLCFNDALSYYHKNKLYNREADLNIFLGSIYDNQNDFYTSIFLYLKALYYYSSVDSPHYSCIQVRNICNSIGILLSELKDYNKAQKFYDLSNSINQEFIDDKEFSKLILHNIGSLHYRCGNIDTALKAYLTAYSDISEVTDFQSALNIAYCYLEKQDLEKVYRYVKVLDEKFIKANDVQKSQLYYLKAKVYAVQKNESKRIECLELCIKYNTTNTLNGLILNDKLNARTPSLLFFCLYDIISIDYDKFEQYDSIGFLKDAMSVLDFTEKYINYLTQRPNDSFSSIRLKQDILQFNDLQMNILMTAVQNQLLTENEYYAKLLRVIDNHKYKILEQSIEKHINQNIDVAFQIRPLLMELSSKTSIAEINRILKNHDLWSDFDKTIRQSLDRKRFDLMPSVRIDSISIEPSELVYNIFSKGNTYYAYIMELNNIWIEEIGEKDIIDSIAKEYTATMRRYENKWNNRETLLLMSEYFIKPIRNHLDKIVKISFIPDGGLDLFPFESLINTSDNRYLIESYRVRIFNSFSLYLKDSNSNDDDFSSFLGLSPVFKGIKTGLVAIPYANEEVKIIDSIFNSHKLDSRCFIGNSATLGALHKYGNTDVIHISTHANNSRREISGNYIVLAAQSRFFKQNKNEYYYVKLEDICNFDMDCNLMVLSACSTGKGVYLAGEGLVNIARGFSIVGVENILYTRWNAPDKFLKTFFVVFYQYLIEFQSVELALHRTKLFFASSQEYSDPSFWDCITQMGL